MANAVELADHTGAKISDENPLPVAVVAGGAGVSEVEVTNFPAT